MTQPTPAKASLDDIYAGQRPPAEKPSTDGDFMRGIKRTLPELKQLGGGTLAAIGDVTGWDGLRDKGLEIYQAQERKMAPLHKDTDSASEAWKRVKQGDVGAGVDFLQNAAGYTVGQGLESLAASAAGAAIGGALTPEVAGLGAIPGAVGGFVAKQGIKRTLKGQAEKLIAEQVARGAAKAEAKAAGAEYLAQRATKDALAAQVGKQYTEAQLRKLGGRTLGAVAGTQGMNTVMELGSVYPEALKQAEEDGREMTGSDKARAVGASLAAAGVESAADLFNLGKLARGLREAGSDVGKSGIRRTLTDYAKRAAVEVPEGMVREAGTEAVQTGLERFGAGQSLTDAEAMQDYIDSAAVGAVGGGLFGSAAAVRRPGAQANSGEQPPSAETDAPPAEPLALPPPDGSGSYGVNLVTPDGTVITPQQRGVDPRVVGDPASPVPNPAATPGLRVDASSLNQQRAATLPDGSPLPDPAGGVLSRAVNAAAENGALGTPAPAGVSASGLADGARALEPAMPSTPPPWVDVATGEQVREPSRDDIKLLLHAHIDNAMASGGKANSGKAATDIIRNYGLPERTVRSLAEQVRGERKQGITAANYAAAHPTEPLVQAQGGEPSEGAAGTQPTPAPAPVMPTAGLKDDAAPAAVQPTNQEPGQAAESTGILAAQGVADTAGATAGQSSSAESKAGQEAEAVQPFAPETGTLGIPRAEMPQVPTQAHGGLVNHLNAQGIAHETTMVDAGSLKPTQAEYSPAKVEQARQATGDRAVIVSNDGHIIDGHHQAVAAAEDGKPVKAIVLDAPVEQALDAVKNSPSAATQAAAAPAAPQSANNAAVRYPITEYTTGKGKVLRGTVRTDLTHEQAKAIDPYTMRHAGGQFIREKHFDALTAHLGDAAGGSLNELPSNPDGLVQESPTQGKEKAGTFTKAEAKENSVGEGKLTNQPTVNHESKPASPITVRKAGAGAVAMVIDPSAMSSSEPTTGETAPSDPAKKLRKSAKAKAEAERAEISSYFTPGNIVKSYGGFDEVLSYQADENGGFKSVTVQEVRKDGDEWVRVGKPQDARTHRTEPDARELESGPVDRVPDGEARYTEPRADGQPFPNAPRRGPVVDAPAVEPTELKPVDDRFAGNKLFTSDAVEKARARMRSKLGQLNSGLDPELLVDGMTVAGAYIESGVRKFADYAKAMVADFGDGIRPYLLSFYEGVRSYPGLDTEGMSSVDEAKRLHAGEVEQTPPTAAALGTVSTAKPKQPDRKPGKGPLRKLRQDWGVDNIDGWTPIEGGKNLQGDSGLKGGLKDAFLADARAYLREVAGMLEARGFTPHSKKGAVSVNEGGPAGSGEVSLAMKGPDGSGHGVYVQVGASSLRGVVPASQAGVSVMFRIPEHRNMYGSGINQWASPELAVADLVQEVTRVHGQQAKVPAQAARPEAGPARVWKNSTPEQRKKLLVDAGYFDIGQRTQFADSEWPDLPDAVKRALSAPPAPLETKTDYADNTKLATAPLESANGNRQHVEANLEQPGAGQEADAGRAAGDAGGQPGAIGAGGGVRPTEQPPERSGSAGAVRDPAETVTTETPATAGVSASSTRKSTPAPASIPASDFTITNELDFAGVGAVGKFNGNLAAIRLLKTLEAEGRRATAAEQSVLARYVGWGGLPQAFRNGNKVTNGWESRVAELEALLTPEELAAAGRSTQDAHYTAKNVVDAMWQAVARLGFNKGRVLEPSMGTGNFFGLMPQGLRAASSMTGVELDSLTGRIAKQLYQTANVQVRGFNDLKLSPGSFDLVIGNPPFGRQSIHDGQYPELSKWSIHNFFFGKAVASTRPGGVVAMVVSSSLMDANTSTARAWMGERAKLLGAIRLPQTAFQQNAGTNVTTDIIFLQRLGKGEKGNAEQWVNAGRVASTEMTEGGYSLNQYFIDNPQMMLGRMVVSRQNTVGNGRPMPVLEAHPGQDLDAALQEAIAKLPQGVVTAAGKTTEQVNQQIKQGAKAERPANVKVYGYFVDPNGVLRQRMPDIEGQANDVVVEKNAADDKRIRGQIGIRNAARWLLAQESSDAAPDVLDQLRQRLNDAYDSYVKEFGPLTRDTNKRAFRDDSDNYLLLSLERDYQSKISPEQAKKKADGTAPRAESVKKADIFTKRVNYPVKPVTRVDDAKSAMFASLNEKGRLDMDYMASLYPGKDAQAIETELGDLVFRTPEGELVPRDAYLSGNVKAKLVAARAAAATDPAFQRHVAALEAVIPTDVDAVDIFVQIGTPWISTEDWNAFAAETFEGTAKGSYMKALGKWGIKFTSSNQTLNHERWGTQRMGAAEIVEALMTDKPIVVKDRGANRDDPPVVNQQETAAALGKAQELQTQFVEWLWKDADRRERLMRLYNDTYNTDVRRVYDGSHMTFPGMSGAISLRPHQANYVYRVVQDGTVLADHVVGAGKTFAAIAGVMEQRRIGNWRKPMIVVPNHLVEQWATDFARLYPGANVLAAGRKDFEKGKRKQLFARIATGDWDAVIVAHSSFGFIPVPARAESDILKQEINEIEQALDAVRAGEGKNSLSFKQMQKRKESLDTRITQLNQRPRDDIMDFAEMGVDALVVDEAHEFKNLYFVTSKRGASGLGSPEGSKKAFDLYVKTRMLAGMNGGKNRMFLTGTPVSNSLSEIFHMQRYLQREELEARNVGAFDAWLSVFGQVSSDWEMDAAGRFKEKTRFRKLANLPELVSIWRQVADVVGRQQLIEDAKAQGKTFPLPAIKGGKPQNVVVPRSPQQAEFIGVAEPLLDAEGKQQINEETGEPLMRYPEGSIIHRMDNMPKDPSLDNYLKATSDARKAGLDYRLVDEGAPDFKDSKINVAVGRILERWKKNDHRKGTQLVFCDLSVPASARGRATEAAQAKRPTWFVRDGSGIEHVAGVKLSLAAMPDGKFFTVKGRRDYAVYEATSGKQVAAGRSKQEAIDEANAKIASFDMDTFRRNIERGAIPAEEIDAYVQRWEDMQAEQEATSGEEGESGGANAGVSMDELLADQGNSRFSVYDDMKAKLIAGGMPANQIAFIHDYNTDAQKQALFGKVKSGEIRVLFGSTQKMGAGMNVQDRLVGLTHMDAPWKPSDLEQREGRIIRQGNRFVEVASPEYDPAFEIEIDRMATAETYDARMWEIIQTKAEGIEAFKAGDGATREIDDISSEAANAADMKASSSGNPLILESIKLRREIKEMEAQERSFNRSRNSMESLIRNVDKGETYGHKALAEARDIAAKLDMTGPFELVLDGKTYTDRKDVKAVAVAKLVKDAITKHDVIEGGTFRGGRLLFDGRHGIGVTVHMVVGNNPVQQVGNTGFGSADTVTAPGFITRLENIIAGAGKRIEQAQAIIKQSEKEADQAREDVKRGFPKADALKAKRERAAKVLLALKSGKRAVEGDPEKPMFSRAASAVPGRGTGLSPARARALVQELTRGWGENRPTIRVAETPQEWAGALRAAGVQDAPGNARIEGMYDGSPVVWLNPAALATEKRLAEVLAHEAIGHYGVERIVGKEQWAQITGAIDRLRTSGKAVPSIQKVLDEVSDRYVNRRGGLDLSTAEGRETFAKEVIAVLAEKGTRNSWVSRVLAAVRRWLRQHMPSMKWTERDVLDLLGQADSFLRAGRTQAQQRELVQRYAFSKRGEQDVRDLSPEQIEQLRALGLLNNEQADLLEDGGGDAAARTAARRVLRDIAPTMTREEVDAKLAALEKVKARLQDLKRAVTVADIDGPMTPELRGKITRLGFFLQGFAQGNPDAFDYARAPNGEKDIQKIAEAMMQADGVEALAFTRGKTDAKGVQHWTIKTANDREGTFEVEPDGTLQLHIGDLLRNSGEGSFLYAVFNTWAARNGYKAVPDRAGLSEVNKYRRTASMLSSALREGGTGHLMPHETQNLPHWAAGNGKNNTAFNIGYMALREAKRVLDPKTAKLRIHLLDKLRYDFDQNHYVDSKGRAISAGEYAAVLSQTAAGQGAVGRRSAQRAHLAASAFSEAERRGIATTGDALAWGSRVVQAGAESRLRVAADPTGHAAGDSDALVLDGPLTARNIYYSRPADETPADAGVSVSDPLDDIEAVQRLASGTDKTLLERARALLADITPAKVKDAIRGTWLGALTTRHLTELGQDYFKNIRHYSDYLSEMQADRNQMQGEAEEIAEPARKWASKNPKEAQKLFGLMHKATVEGVDPAKDYEPLKFKAGGRGLQEVNYKNVAHQIKVLRQIMRERSGDSKQNMMNEIRALNSMRKAEPRRRAAYGPLVAEWNQLSPEAKALYVQMRDAYAKRSQATEEALVQRMMDLKGEGVSDHQVQVMVMKLRQQFESNRLQGVYFPLQRFGRYFVAATKEDASTFLMFPNLNQLEKAVRDMRSRGWSITAQGLKAEGKAKDAPSGTFVAEVIMKLREANISDKTQDAIYQVYLEAMPELSMRKHQIHRRAVPGFDTDAVRAFAYNMHHGSHQLARLRYSHKLQQVLDLLSRQQDDARKEPDADTRRIAAGDALIGELKRRHEWILNPTDNQLTNLVSSAGFVYYLGATPAAALVNLTQTPLISFPYLAARFGAGKTMNYLMSASRDAVRTVGNIQRTLTDPAEQRAYAALQASGAIDKTQAHNLAGISEGGVANHSPAWAKAMEIIGWGFHKTEVVNREATGMAAFRLAVLPKERGGGGMGFNEAVKFAHDAVFDTHYDYSNANRARFMQNGTAKVLLMFRQYSLNTTWMLGRAVWQATKAADPETKRLARRQLAGVMGMSALFSGALGLPMMGMTMGVLNALAASFGNDDEPWDAETEFRAFLNDMLGKGASELVQHGALNKLTGADIASRVGMSDLWFRDADRELEGKDYYHQLLEQAAGPMGGVLKNVIVGKSLIDEGHTWRGVETMLPKALKDTVKSIRYGAQGVNTLRGDAVVEDLPLYKVMLQGAGFTPAQVSAQYERNSDLMNYQQHIMDRRQHLMDAFGMAVRLGDDAARRSTLAKIAAFNQINPEVAITPATIRNSMRARVRYSARAEGGIMLNPKLAAKLKLVVGAE